MKDFSISCLLVIIFLLIVSCEKEVSVSPPDEPAPKGELFINSYPKGFDIYVDGKFRIRQTPDSLQWLKTDEYLVTLKHELFLDSTVSVSVIDGETVSLFIDFSKDPKNRGNLYVNSIPLGAQIFINDSNTTRKTPYTFKDMLAGIYNLKLTYPDHLDYTKNVSVKSQRISSAKAALVDTTAWTLINTKNSDIPFDRLTSTAKDNRDILWVGTDKGLLRYSEATWKLITPGNSELPHKVVKALEADDFGNIWIATNGGIGVADRNSVVRGWPLSLKGEFVTSIQIDEVTNKHVYFSTESSFVTMDISSMSYIKDFIPGYYYFTAVAVDANYRCLGSSEFGFLAKNTQNDEIWTAYDKTNSELPGNEIRALGKSDEGIWIAHRPSEAGGWQLSLFDAGEIKKFSLTAPPYPMVNIIFVDNNNIKWIGTETGVFVFDNFEDKILLDESTTGLPLFDVTGISESPLGEIMITTWANGLFILKNVSKYIQ